MFRCYKRQILLDVEIKMDISIFHKYYFDLPHSIKLIHAYKSTCIICPNTAYNTCTLHVLSYYVVYPYYIYITWQVANYIHVYVYMTSTVHDLRLHLWYKYKAVLASLCMIVCIGKIQTWQTSCAYKLFMNFHLSIYL